MVTTDPLLGRLVDGRYEIRSRIARGGMATVYLALDRRLDREVALKVMHPHLAEGLDGAAFLSRFRREARAAARLTHPGVVAVYDQGLDGDTSYLTMEYVRGSNVRRELRDSGTLSVRRTLDLLAPVLAALGAAHAKGLVHRDVKPENVLIAANDGQVKVADFGLARAVTEVTSTTTGTVLGTVAYLAPEVITTGGCDARTDVYAVGVLAYELLTGALPFEGEPIQVAFQHVHHDVPPPSARVPWMPPAIDDLVAAFTARDPAARPADGAAALDLLRKVRFTLAAEDPELLDRRADPPAGFVPAGAGRTTAAAGADDVGAPAGADAGGMDTDDDAAALDAIPLTGPVLTPGGGVRLGDPADAHATERLVDQATARVDVGSGTGLEPWPAADASPDDGVVPGPGPGPGPGAIPARRSRRRVVGWVITVLLLLGGAGYGAWWYFEDGPGAWTTVPAGLEDTAVDQATERLTSLGLDSTQRKDYHDDVPAGSVISTDPGPGDPVRRDGRVELLVSRGVRMLTVPDGLVGTTQEEAEAALRDVGLDVGEPTKSWDDRVPAGEVMAADQEPGASVPHDTVITLTVSGGPAPVTITQQVGRERADAVAALEDAGLRVEFTADESSMEVPAGRILRQSPESGTRAHRLDTVTLTVSSGPPIVAVPNVVDMRTADATAALEAAGFTVEVRRQLGGLLGRVWSQEPAGEAPQGSTITITIV